MAFPTRSRRRKEVILKVIEAKQRDVGKGKVRIDVDMLRMIDVEPGEVVEIEGKKLTAATAWPAYPEDRGKDVIRMDGLLRRNAGVGIGEKVIVRKADVRPAIHIKLSPASFSISVDPGFVNYIKKKLIDYPLVEGDTVFVPVLNQSIPFLVVSTKPSGVVVLTPETNLILLDRPIEPNKIPRVTYEDIGGMKEIIQRVRELVELPLKHPEIFKRLGIEPPKGILLYGPPGVGKTLLAKAIANEASARFIAINGPEIMSKYYGESEQRLREIFEEAKKNAPSIIFIDEIDAIAPKRDEVTGEVERRVVAQLLALMDGLESRGEVIVIAATNRINAVDPALRRPGRFDREIEIPLPDKQGRLEILQIHTRNMPLAPDVDLVRIAELTRGYTGADLAALVKEAAMHALRRYLPKIDLSEDTIPPELLESMEIRMEDFVRALRDIIPSGLREIYIEVPEVHWNDVGGLDEVKQQLREAVEWPIKSPHTFTRLGITPPKGILLFGPPGTGKTLLAKAVATESGANFIALRGPEVLSKWVGESEKIVREVFRKARQHSPAIVFFDEIDAIAQTRGSFYDSSGVTYRIVNQLLAELDGIVPLSNVVFVAATNRPDMLDPALLRPGRLDKIIYVPPPDKKARLEILRIHTRKMPLAEDVDLEKIAALTENYSGADLEAVVREAAMIALREDFSASRIFMDHFMKAIKIIRPSITPEMVKFYEDWYKQAKQTLSTQSSSQTGPSLFT